MALLSSCCACLLSLLTSSCHCSSTLMKVLRALTNWHGASDGSTFSLPIFLEPNLISSSDATSINSTLYGSQISFCRRRPVVPAPGLHGIRSLPRYHRRGLVNIELSHDPPVLLLRGGFRRPSLALQEDEVRLCRSQLSGILLGHLFPRCPVCLHMRHWLSFSSLFGVSTLR